MNSVENISSALQREQRRPIDFRLGQVPVTPTVGRLGQFNVVTRSVLRDNAASEISRAFSQLPQFVGQARNISEASGREQADQLSLDEIEERWKKGDTEAEGFMTWLGGNKAFEEAAYQRLFDANIKPSLTKVSSEIDNMSMAELAQLKADEDISEFVQARLVGALDPEILETIKNSPFQSVRHNRAMEALIPDYTQRAAATINARKKAFQKKEAARAIESNLITFWEGGIPPYKPSEDADTNPEREKRKREEFNTKANKDYQLTLQQGLDFTTQTALAAGLDKFEIEDKIVATISAKFGQLVEDEQFTEADLFLEQLETGVLKVNGRPINQSVSGLRMITTAERILENEIEAEENKLDATKLNDFKAAEISSYNDAILDPEYDVENYVEGLQQRRADLDQGTYNSKEQIELNDFLSRRIDYARGQEAIHAQTRNEAKKETIKKLEKEYPIKATGLTTIDKVREAAIGAGMSPQVFDDSLLEEAVNASGQITGEKVFRDPALQTIFNNAEIQARNNTYGEYSERPEEELYFGQYGDEESQQAQGNLRTNITGEFGDAFHKILGGMIQNYVEVDPRLSKTTTEEEKVEKEKDRVEQAQELNAFLRDSREGGVVVDGEGNIQSDIEQRGFEDLSETKRFKLEKANRTFETQSGRQVILRNPLQKRMELADGLAYQATDSGRVHYVGKSLDKVFKTDSYEVGLKNEIEKVRHSGISMNAIRNRGVVEGTYLTGGFWKRATGREDKNTFYLRYNQYGTFSNPEETTKRIYNMNAVKNFMLMGNRKGLDEIQELFLPEMDPQTFADNQVKFYESRFGPVTEKTKQNDE